MESIAVIILHKLAESLLRSFIVGTLIAAALYLIGNEIVRGRSRIPGLKGPRGWPVVGNLTEIRSNAPAKYQEWAKEYGDVYQVMLGNNRVVVVNGAQAAKTIFSSNSQALSSRPITYTFHKVTFTTQVLWRALADNRSM